MSIPLDPPVLTIVLCVLTFAAAFWLGRATKRVYPTDDSAFLTAHEQGKQIIEEACHDANDIINDAYKQAKAGNGMAFYGRVGAPKSKRKSDMGRMRSYVRGDMGYDEMHGKGVFEPAWDDIDSISAHTNEVINASLPRATWLYLRGPRTEHNSDPVTMHAECKTRSHMT